MERGAGVGGNGLSVEFLEIFGRDAVLSLSCIVSCGLLSLEEMAAMEINDSFNVSVSSNFCVFVPETKLI